VKSYEKEWNMSYANRDNFVFYPQEDVIRFISKYISKRIGLDDFIDKNNYLQRPKVLDFGCGIGRHVKLLDEFKLDAYGFDLSKEAIAVAKSNFAKLKLHNLADKIIVSDITKLPYKNDYFDFMLSHGVLDSMPFEIAKKGINELYRVLKPNGLIYLDLISTDDSSFDNSKLFERTISQEHEKGTIQTYFNIERIKELIEPKYEIVEIYKITKEDQISLNLVISRFHIIIKKKYLK
jgi:ubiquinone/menaquinone biosynthesis C-methylase UbiE